MKRSEAGERKKSPCVSVAFDDFESVHDRSLSVILARGWRAKNLGFLCAEPLARVSGPTSFTS
jgi:hypothetical protein